jgi:hypothetical protein
MAANTGRRLAISETPTMTSAVMSVLVIQYTADLKVSQYQQGSQSLKNLKRPPGVFVAPGGLTMMHDNVELLLT